ncbi:hypothetical protein CORC01_10244 [Colletotrichum orchidophilum]|uniref:Uncharacterized protein n=1 Tax=Colletotrichum orchidophilum TaxID=1209926 RepID=A0A1G4AZA9_9PEZI|nr:uncharacterized protein CORC01_10244 [Colletotrichum orchidophilum]OHE94425.1 hypothetical protein CORC01_10244 [Colletotrichum orchidophilum]
MQTVIFIHHVFPSLPIVPCALFRSSYSNSTRLPQESTRLFSHFSRKLPYQTRSWPAGALTVRTNVSNAVRSPPINRPPSRPISSYPFQSLAISPPRVGLLLSVRQHQLASTKHRALSR